MSLNTLQRKFRPQKKRQTELKVTPRKVGMKLNLKTPRVNLLRAMRLPPLLNKRQNHSRSPSLSLRPSKRQSHKGLQALIMSFPSCHH